jgi:hypothetical protein
VRSKRGPEGEMITLCELDLHIRALPACYAACCPVARLPFLRGAAARQRAPLARMHSQLFFPLGESRGYLHRPFFWKALLPPPPASPPLTPVLELDY